MFRDGGVEPIEHIERALISYRNEVLEEAAAWLRYRRSDWSLGWQDDQRTADALATLKDPTP
jgi:hypothetical protein